MPQDNHHPIHIQIDQTAIFKQVDGSPSNEYLYCMHVFVSDLVKGLL